MSPRSQEHPRLPVSGRIVLVPTLRYSKCQSQGCRGVVAGGHTTTLGRASSPENILRNPTEFNARHRKRTKSPELVVEWKNVRGPWAFRGPRT